MYRTHLNCTWHVQCQVPFPTNCLSPSALYRELSLPTPMHIRNQTFYLPFSFASSTAACYCVSNSATHDDGCEPSNSTTCPRGEMCARDIRFDREKDILSESPLANVYNSVKTTYDKMMPPFPVRAHRGLTLHSCEHNSECVAPSRCAERALSNWKNTAVCTTNRKECLCHGGR